MNKNGFTLIELMVVIAIIGILASVTLPSYAGKIHQAKIESSIQFTKFARDEISKFYKHNGNVPSTNAEAGLPEPELFISNETSRVDIIDGAIHITLGKRVSVQAEDKIVSIRPAVIDGESRIPISWIIGYASVPEGLTVLGENKTNVDSSYLSYNYRW